MRLDFGASESGDGYFTTDVYSVTGSLMWLVDRHNFKFGSEYRRYVERQLADRHGVAADDVEVTVGRVGASDEDTRAALETALVRVAERRDPDDPDVSYEALSIQYLAGDGEAVADSFYLDPGARDLDEIAAGPASGRG